MATPQDVSNWEKQYGTSSAFDIKDAEGKTIGTTPYDEESSKAWSADKKMYQTASGQWSVTPDTSVTLDDDGNVLVRAPKSYLESESLKNLLKNSDLEIASKIYKMNKDAKLPTADGGEISVPDLVQKYDDALKEYASAMVSQTYARTLFRDDLGDDIWNMSIDNVMAATSVPKDDNDAIYIPNHILSRFKNITKLDSYDAEKGTVKLSDFRDNIFSMEKTSKEELVSLYNELGKYFTKRDFSDLDEYSKSVSLRNFISSTEPGAGFWDEVGLNLGATVEGAARATADFTKNIGVFAEGAYNAILNLFELGTTALFGWAGYQKRELKDIPGYSDIMVKVDDELRKQYEERANYYNILNKDSATLFMLSYLGTSIAENITTGKAVSSLISGYAAAVTAARATQATYQTAVAAGMTPLANFSAWGQIMEFATGSTKPTWLQTVNALSKIDVKSLYNGSATLINGLASMPGVQASAALTEAVSGAIKTMRTAGKLAPIAEFGAEVIIDTTMSSPVAMRKIIEGISDEEDRNELWSNIAWNAGGYAAGLLLGKIMSAFPNTTVGQAANAHASKKIKQLSVVTSDLSDSLKTRVYGDKWLDNIKNTGKKQVGRYKQIIRQADSQIAAAKTTDEITSAQRQYEATQNAIDDLQRGVKERIKLYNSDFYPSLKDSMHTFDQKETKLNELLTKYEIPVSSTPTAKICGVASNLGLPQDVVNYVNNGYAIEYLERKANLPKEAGGGLNPQEAKGLEIADNAAKEFEKKYPQEIIDFINDEYYPALQNAFYQINVLRGERHLESAAVRTGLTESGLWGDNGQLWIRTQRVSELQKLADDTRNSFTTSITGFVRKDFNDELQHYQWGSEEDYVHPMLVLQNYLTATAYSDVNRSFAEAVLPMYSNTIKVDGDGVEAVSMYKRNKKRLAESINSGIKDFGSKIETRHPFKSIYSQFEARSTVEKIEKIQEKQAKKITKADKTAVLNTLTNDEIDIVHSQMPKRVTADLIWGTTETSSDINVALAKSSVDLYNLSDIWDEYLADEFYNYVKDGGKSNDKIIELLGYEYNEGYARVLSYNLYETAKVSESPDEFFDSSKKIIDDGLDRVVKDRLAFREEPNVIITSKDYANTRFPSSTDSIRLIESRSNRRKIYNKYLRDEETMWFTDADRSVKARIADKIYNNSELHNAMLSEMYELSGSSLSFEKWLNAPIELTRVQVNDMPGEEDAFLSFSMRADWDEHWKKANVDKGTIAEYVPGDTVKLTIKPKDTFGAHIVADGVEQQMEVLVPKDAYMDAWESSDTSVRKELSSYGYNSESLSIYDVQSQPDWENYIKNAPKKVKKEIKSLAERYDYVVPTIEPKTVDLVKNKELYIDISHDLSEISLAKEFVDGYFANLPAAGKMDVSKNAADYDNLVNKFSEKYGVSPDDIEEMSKELNAISESALDGLPLGSQWDIALEEDPEFRKKYGDVVNKYISRYAGIDPEVVDEELSIDDLIKDTIGLDIEGVPEVVYDPVKDYKDFLEIQKINPDAFYDVARAELQSNPAALDSELVIKKAEKARTDELTDWQQEQITKEVDKLNKKLKTTYGETMPKEAKQEIAKLEENIKEQRKILKETEDKIERKKINDGIKQLKDEIKKVKDAYPIDVTTAEGDILPIISDDDAILAADDALTDLIDSVRKDPLSKQTVDAVAVGTSEENLSIAEEYIILSYADKNKKVLTEELERAVNKGKAGIKGLQDKTVEAVNSHMKKVLETRLEQRLDRLRNILKGAGEPIADSDDVLDTIKKLRDDVEEAVDNQNVIAHYNDAGKMELIETDPVVADLINYKPLAANSKAEAFFGNPVFRGMNRLARTFETTLSPKSYKNQWFRDPSYMYFTTGAHEGIRSVSQSLADEFGEVLIENLKKESPETYELLLKKSEETGIPMSELVANREVAVGESLSEQMTATSYYADRSDEQIDALYGGLQKTKKKLGDVLDKIMNVAEKPNQWRESWLRKLSYDNGLRDGLRRGMSVKEARQHALFFQRNATTNFHRQLYHFRAFQKTVNYFGAAVNGSTSFWRMFSIDPIGVSCRIFGGLIVPTIVAAVVSLGDEQNREKYFALKEYEKENQFIFMANGQMYKIPIPQELNTFLAPARHAVEKLYGANKHAFWELAMNDLLGIAPVDFNGLMMIDRDQLANDPTILDRMGSLAVDLIDQTAPNAVKSIFSGISGIDTYTGDRIDTSYTIIDEDGNIQLVGGTQRKFALALGNALGWSPSVVAKVTEDLIGTVGADILDVVIGGESPVSLLEKATKDVTSFKVSDYDRINSEWKGFVADMWHEKETNILPQYIQYCEEINRADDPDQIAKLKAKRDDLVQPFLEKVKNGVANLKNKYGGSYDRFRFGAIVSLLTFDTGVTLGNTAESRIRDDDNYWENVAQARQWMEGLGISSTDEGSILGYLTYDKDGNAVMKYNTPASILAARDVIYSRGERDAAELKILLEEGSNSIKKQKSAVDAQVKIIRDGKEKLSDSDYDQIDAIYINWNAKVMAAIEPYLRNRSAEDVLSSEVVRELLDNYLELPGDYAINDKGRYVSLGSRGNKKQAYIDSYIRDIFNVKVK